MKAEELAIRQALRAAQEALDAGHEPDEALPGLAEKLEELAPADRAAVGEQIAGLAKVDALLRGWPEPPAPEGELAAIADVVLQRLDDDLPALDGDLDVTAAPVFDDDDAQPRAETSGPEALISGAYSLDALTAHVSAPAVAAAETAPPAAPVVQLADRRPEAEASSPPMKIWLAAAAAVGLGFVGFAMYSGDAEPDSIAMSAPAAGSAAYEEMEAEADMADMAEEATATATPTAPGAAAGPMDEAAPETEAPAELAEAEVQAEAEATEARAQLGTTTERAITGARGEGGARTGTGGGAYGGLDDALAAAPPSMRRRARPRTSASATMSASMSSPEAVFAAMAAARSGGESEDSDADIARRAARRTRTAVRACLPAETGAVRVLVDVEGSTGRVRRVVATQPGLAQSVQSCIQQAMRGALFPERDADFRIDVRY